MNDNEIIKALECCSKSSWLNDCEGCPCYDDKEDIQTSECQERLMKNALDLIKRQKEEIERLKNEIKGFDNFLKETDCSLKEIKDNAINEFVEMAKQKSRFITTLSCESRSAVLISDIDDIKKEMIEKGGVK